MPLELGLVAMKSASLLFGYFWNQKFAQFFGIRGRKAESGDGVLGKGQQVGDGEGVWGSL